MLRAVRALIESLAALLARACPCGFAWPRAGLTRWSRKLAAREGLGLLVCGLLLLPVSCYAVWRDGSARLALAEVEATVTGARALETPAGLVGQIELRYARGGREERATLYRALPPEPATDPRDREREQAFVSAAQPGAPLRAWIDPAAPGTAWRGRWDAFRALMLVALALGALLAGASSLGEVLHAQATHLEQHHSARPAGPGFDAVGRERWLGPRLGLAWHLGLFAQPLAVWVTADHAPVWAAVLGLVALAAAVSLTRLARALAAYHAFRTEGT